MSSSLQVLMEIPDLAPENKKEEFEAKIKEASAELAAITHAYIVEQAEKKLHTRKDDFIESLQLEELEDGIWEIKIPDKMSWVEDGIPAGFDMLPGLLASPKAKQGKNGKYLVVPFEHRGKQGEARTPVQIALTDSIKNELKKRKLPNLRNIEKNPDGSPKLGLLHKFSIKTPVNMADAYGMIQTKNQKPWMANRPSEDSSSPILNKVKIYQTEHKDSHGRKSVKRSAVTFRMASESQSGRKWLHPGLEPMNFLDEASEWADKKWEEEFLPKILEELNLN